MTKKLGVYDSGLGGFSLIKEILKEPFVTEIYYYSDYENLPYGNLSIAELKERGIEICQYLIDQDVDAILLACNTATVNTIDLMRQRFSIPFVGVEPYISAIKKEQSLKGKCNIGLVVTPATAKSERVNWLKCKFDHDDRVTIVASEGLAKSIELYIRGNRENKDMRASIRRELIELRRMGFDALILGCTHYPLVIELFELILDIPIIDPGAYVIQQLKKVVWHNETPSNRQVPTISYSENLKSNWKKMMRSQIEGML